MSTLLSIAETGRLLGVPTERVDKLLRHGALLAQAGPDGSPQVPQHDAARLCSTCMPGLHHHAVQFFEDEDFLANVVGAFLEEGLRCRAPLVVIARPHRREMFLHCLDELNCNPASAVERGQLLLLDAEETLRSFMGAELPDAGRFVATIAPVLKGQRAAWPGARLRAYGEMVDVLWQRGQAEAAVRLEELWNELAQRQSFSLLCAYSMHRFDDPRHARLFDRVCETHSAVAPTEACTQAGNADQQQREIVHLDQRIRMLEARLRAYELRESPAAAAEEPVPLPV